MEMRQAVAKLWTTCASLTRLDLCAAMIDVQDVLCTLPNEVQYLAIGHYGVTSCDSVLKGIKTLTGRRQLGLEQVRLHVR